MRTDPFMQNAHVIVSVWPVHLMIYIGIVELTTAVLPTWGQIELQQSGFFVLEAL